MLGGIDLQTSSFGSVAVGTIIKMVIGFVRIATLRLQETCNDQMILALPGTGDTLGE